MTEVFIPSLALWALTVGLAAFHAVRFYRFAFGEISPVGAPISAALVALLAAIVYPLAFFSVGAFAWEPAHEALQWLDVSGFPVSAAVRGLIVATADGALSAVFTYFVAFGIGAAVMGARA